MLVKLSLDPHPKDPYSHLSCGIYFLWNIFLEQHPVKLFAWADDVLLLVPFDKNRTDKLPSSL